MFKLCSILGVKQKKVKIDPKILVDYFGNVQPREVQGKVLSKLDSAVKQAVECAEKGNKKGYKSAEELIGRIMAGKE